jgi:Tfp pilus assembly protein PilO
MMKVSKRDKRVLIFGGIFTVIVLLVVYVILPFMESQSQIEADLQQAEERLQQSMRVIQSEPYYRAQQSELEEVLRRYQSQLLDAEDSNRARVQLQEIVDELAEENGVTISRSTPIQERQVGENYAEVTLQINLDTGMQELASFLYAISTHPKFLKVEQFQINMHRSRRRRSMQPRMNVSAFIRLSEA